MAEATTSGSLASTSPAMRPGLTDMSEIGSLTAKTSRPTPILRRRS